MISQVSWNITEKCNMSCKHCYATGIRKQAHDVSLNEAKAMILKFKEMGINNFHLLGGEPLCSNNIADIILFFKNNDVYYSLNTNGTNINENIVDLFNTSNITNLSISMEGIHENTYEFIRGKGNYKKIINSIELLSKSMIKRENLLLGIDFVVTKGNCHELIDLPSFALENGFNGISINPLGYSGNAKSFWKEIYCDNALYLEKLCDMYSLIKNNNYQNVLLIHLGDKPQVRKYIEEKIGITVVGDFIGDMCCVRRDNINISNNGVIFPCPKIYERDINSKYDKINCFEEIYNLNSYQTFNKTISEENKLTCNCEFNSLCEPCPIDIDQIKLTKDLCFYVMDLRRDNMEYLMNTKYAVFVDSIEANHCGKQIFELLKESFTPKEIAKQLSASYGYPIEDINDDVWEFVRELWVNGII